VLRVHIRGFRAMIFNDTFNKNVSGTEQTQYPEKTNDLPQFADIIDHMMLYRVHLAMRGIQIHKGCK
jgi:hypothetical protein